jgi:hypothetical protein
MQAYGAGAGQNIASGDHQPCMCMPSYKGRQTDAALTEYASSLEPGRPVSELHLPNSKAFMRSMNEVDVTYPDVARCFAKGSPNIIMLAKRPKLGQPGRIAIEEENATDCSQAE